MPWRFARSLFFLATVIALIAAGLLGVLHLVMAKAAAGSSSFSYTTSTCADTNVATTLHTGDSVSGVASLVITGSDPNAIPFFVVQFTYNTSQGPIFEPVVQVGFPEPYTPQPFTFVAPADGQVLACAVSNSHTGTLVATGTVEGTITPAQPQSALLAVNLSVTPTTPMWKMDALIDLDPTQLSCPARLSLKVGKIQSIVQNICAGQTSVPTQIHLLVPVFDNVHPSNTLAPGSTVAVLAQLTGGGNQPSSLSTKALIPPQPVWIGLGDSFASGFNEAHSSPCPFLSPLCGVQSESPTYAWITQAALMLNNRLNVPLQWRITSHLFAKGGASTTDMKTKQQAQMIALLSQHAGSWNIVSIDGGANDINFAIDLAKFYIFNGSTVHTVPWNVSRRGPNGEGCLNTQEMWLAIKGQTQKVVANLQEIVNAALATDPNIRIVDVGYPYVMNLSNVCAQNIVNHGTVTWHGSKSVVDSLNLLHAQITASTNNITHIDLSKGFGASPLGYLQLVYLFGYPHPNPVGQTKIAALAVSGVLQLHP